MTSSAPMSRFALRQLARHAAIPTVMTGSVVVAASSTGAATAVVPAADHEIRFVVDGTTTYGTRHMPAHRPRQRMSAALLLPGSGPTDRNGDQLPAFTPHTLAKLADTLGRDGVVSLRFDKYGTGRAGLGAYAGRPETIDYPAFVRRADAAYRLLARPVAKLWIGVDIGKTHHHVAAVDGDGRLVYSRRVANDEASLLTVIAEVSTYGRPFCWAVDVTTDLSALLLTLLWRRQVQVRYVSGTVAFHMAAAFAGENKTDARDAVVIAQTIRMRPDIPILEPSDRLLAELTVLTGYRADLVGQRVATLFRLQELLTGISPALERAVDLNRKAPMMVLACWQIPAAIRHAGVDRITALLRRGHVKNAVQVAEAMVAAARQQTVNLPGQRAAAVVVGQMATEILALEQRIAAIDDLIAAIDDLIAEQLDQHPLAPIISSLPGMGPLLTAELLVHTAGMTEYNSPTKLAAHAGLAPVSRDSGTVAGNHRPARRYHRRLRHILWMAAFTAARECPISRAYYEKKRAEGKNHRQAILALARRRVDVLWALIRDRKTFSQPAVTVPAAA